jgi:hypothetical protein
LNMQDTPVYRVKFPQQWCTYMRMCMCTHRHVYLHNFKMFKSIPEQ